jgi:diacylglycerol kinase (ATP)
MRKVTAGFGFAIRGIVAAIRAEQNLRIHLVAAVCVIAGAWYYRVSVTEWAVLMVCIGSVIAAELINTAIERLVDLVSPGYDTRAGLIKDISAGAVLVTAIIAAVAGSIIFLPRIW